jgi:Flp pilus assembly protein TadB
MALSSLLFLLGVLLAGGLVFWIWRRSHLHRQSVARLTAVGTHRYAASLPAMPLFPPRHRLAPVVAALIVAAIVGLVIRLPLAFAFSFGLFAAITGYLIESFYATRQRLLIEGQLADAIDLMAGSLHAGAGLLAALESALREAREPIRTQFRDLVGRIRLGDDPLDGLMELAQHVPLETFRLFSLSLAVHWETGGSLAATLTSVGRTIRDRIELTRRVRTQGVEVYASVVAVLAISYGLTWVMWRANPESLAEFLASAFGTYVACGSICLQGIGMLWIARISDIKF